MRRISGSRHAVATLGFWTSASLAVLLLNGCSSVPLGPTADSPAQQAGARSPSTAVPALPPAGSGRGGYYKDDGPADVIPEGLAETPDAQPRIEPINPRTSRPYVIFGKTYTPITHQQPFRQRGMASWYGKKFHGQKTSSGEIYDMFQMTAAHPTLPIPSYARVTHLASGKQIIVRINDRGPFHANRVIDLSYTAALKLGYLGSGSSEVEVERLLPDDIAQINNARATQASEDRASAADVQVGAVAEPAVVTTSTALAPTALAAPVPAASAASSPGPAAVTAAPPGAAAAPAEPARVLAQAGAFYLQLGAFSQRANAEVARQRLAGTAAAPWSVLDVVETQGLYRLYGGPYASRAEAEAAAQTVRLAQSANPIVVQR